MSVLVNETLANASAAYQRGLADSAMARFYNAQAEAYPQNAEAQRTGQYATAYATRAGVPSEIAERQAQAGLLGAQTATAQGMLAPEIAARQAAIALTRGQLATVPADIIQRLQQSQLLAGQAAWYRTLAGQPNAGGQQPSPMYPAGGVNEIPGVTNIGGDVLTGQEEGGIIEPGYEKGASRAPGKAGKGMPAPGPTDSVPAMLAPGEAVLNRGAREHVESFAPGLIAHLNKVGLMRMAAQGGPDSPNNPEARAAQRGVPASKGSKASRDKTSKSSSNPQTSSRASDSQEKPPKKGGTGGGMPGFQMGDPLVGDANTIANRNGLGTQIGLGGGIFDGGGGFVPNRQIMPAYDPFDNSEAARAARPRPTAATPPRGMPTVTSFTPVSTTVPFQSFEAGVEEVFPVTGVMTGLDARALAGRAKEGNQNVSKVARATVNGAGGMPKFAKGATRVKASSKGTKSLAQVPMPAPSQATLPAMPSLPMASVPQPSYPGGSFL